MNPISVVAYPPLGLRLPLSSLRGGVSPRGRELKKARALEACDMRFEAFATDSRGFSKLIQGRLALLKCRLRDNKGGGATNASKALRPDQDIKR